MSTTHAYSTTPTQAIVPDLDAGDHVMYLNGSLVGFARTANDAQSVLDQLSHERHPDSPFSVPLPPRDAITEALGVLAKHDDNPAIYTEATRQLAAGVTIAGTGPDRLIDDMLVRRAPPTGMLALAVALRLWRGALLAWRAARRRPVCLGATRRRSPPAPV